MTTAPAPTILFCATPRHADAGRQLVAGFEQAGCEVVTFCRFDPVDSAPLHKLAEAASAQLVVLWMTSRARFHGTERLRCPLVICAEAREVQAVLRPPDQLTRMCYMQPGRLRDADLALTILRDSGIDPVGATA